MSKTFSLPICEKLVPGGLDYGRNLLVEFEARSLWYETSLTLASQALRDRLRTGYHTFQHIPTEVREDLTGLGVDVRKLEEEGLLGIVDSYTVQTGILPATSQNIAERSLKLSDWSIAFSKAMKGEPGLVASGKLGFHIDDNTGILLQYNGEKEFVDVWRTRTIPLARYGGVCFLHSVVKGVASDAFYKQFESLHDGIIEFKSEERSGENMQYIRVSAMRGKRYDSRWRKLELLDNGEVTLVE